jgi:predicted nucleic acid-binding protein
LRYHLDTSFLIDWQRDDPAIAEVIDGILDGHHRISIDGVTYAEFMAARVIGARKRMVIGAATAMGEWLSLTVEAPRLAAIWLARMDDTQRRAHFADALIASVSHVHGATLLTGDRKSGDLFPVSTEMYR